MASRMVSILIATALLLGEIPLEAAWASPEDTRLSLVEALRMAEARNLSLRAARLEVERGESARRQALASSWPTVSAGTGMVNQGPTLLQGNLDLGYSLDTHGERSARITLADLQAQASRHDYLIQVQRVRLDVMEAYYDLLGATEQARIAREAVARATELLSDTRTLKEAGEGTVFELQRAEVQVALQRQAEIEAGGELAIARRTLARHLALEGTVEASDPVALAGSWKPDLPESIRLALANRRELKLLDLRRASAKAQQALADSATGIDTQLFLSADMKSAVVPGASSLLALDTSLPGTGPGVLTGARLTWPLFDGGAAREAARQARIEADAVAIKHEDVVQALELEVVRTYLSLQAGKEAVSFAAEALQRARAGVETARLRMRSGIGTHTDLILAQADLLGAELGHVKAILGYNRALATMESACLQPSPEID